MKPELTPEDLDRIKQEAKRLDDENFWPLKMSSAEMAYYIAGATNATIYERQQQAELRNKVIDECIAVIKPMKNGFNFNQIDADDAIQNLNSLKTKP